MTGDERRVNRRHVQPGIAGRRNGMLAMWLGLGLGLGRTPCRRESQQLDRFVRAAVIHVAIGGPLDSTYSGLMSSHRLFDERHVEV